MKDHQLRASVIRAAKGFLGLICIIWGVVALLTPLTPGAWLIVVGLQLLGFRFVFDATKGWGKVFARLGLKSDVERDREHR